MAKREKRFLHFIIYLFISLFIFLEEKHKFCFCNLVSPNLFPGTPKSYDIHIVGIVKYMCTSLGNLR